MNKYLSKYKNFVFYSNRITGTSGSESNPTRRETNPKSVSKKFGIFIANFLLAKTNFCFIFFTNSIYQVYELLKIQFKKADL